MEVSQPPTHTPAYTGIHRQEGELTFATIVGIIIRHKYLIGVTVAVAVVFSFILTSRAPDTWSSSTTFVPQRQSGAMGLAAQLGMGGGADMLQSSAFYTELVRFRGILGQIVDSTRISRGGRDVSLPDALGIEAADPRVKRAGAIGAVNDMISVSSTPRTQVVTITARASDPDIAYNVAIGALDAITQFNSEVRQSAAAAERRFIDQRRAEIRADLTQAEERLKAFLKQNRGGLDAPDLDFERQRLATEVALRRDLYSTLSQGYERARMDEVRDTPVITIVEQPERPLGPDPRTGSRGLILAILGGLFAGVLLAFLVESVKMVRRQADQPVWSHS